MSQRCTDLLASLLNSSLVIEVGTPARQYRLSETVRAYVAEKLRGAAEYCECMARHTALSSTPPPAHRLTQEGLGRS